MTNRQWNYFFDSNDNEHLLKVLDFIAINNIPKISSDDLKNLEEEGIINFENLFNKLEESKDKDFYIYAIEKIKNASIEELLEVKGITEEIAKRLKNL